MVKFLTGAFLLLVSTAVVVHSAPACLCNDDPPPAGDNETQFTCAQQKEFGKCNEDFMLGFCECTCDRCCPCNDFPPTDENFTCQQQKDFGKCDAGFMQGFCECTCDRCPALLGGPVTSPTSSENGCPPGQVEIFGQSGCESVRCAQNRQSCANTCGGLTLIKFDCEDVTDGGSSAFGSSCACV